MAKKRSIPRQRKPRADAQRNRGRLLEVAKEAFARFGAGASLDDIARRAGVGPGTLYRHFPTRDSLIEAVYQSEVERLAAAQREFSETLAPIDALRAWMLLVIDFVAAKRIIADALKSVSGDPARLYESARAPIQAANDLLMQRAMKSGDIRSDLDSTDLLQALFGSLQLSSGPGWQQSARRLVDILIAGARPVRSPRRKDSHP